MSTRTTSTNHALAVALANLKGPRPKDVIGTARALASLRRLPEYRTNAALATALGVSREIVREFLSILSLPDSVIQLFEAKQLDTLEQGRRLAQLQRRRPASVEEAAARMVGLSAHDARALVDQMVKHPELGPDEALASVEASKTRLRREFHVVAVLDEPAYRSLEAAAKQKRLSVDQLVTDIVVDWAKSGTGVRDEFR